MSCYRRMFTAKPFDEMPDLELIALYRDSGNTEVVGKLFERYTSLVYGVCLKYLKNREDSRDAVMQIFEKLIDTLREHEISHFRSWLYVLSRNHCLMELRSKKGKRFQEISPVLMENDMALHPEEEPEMEANLTKLEKCMEALGTEQKKCVQLFYLKQKCYQEITEVTGFDFNKVKSFIQNGKRNLKICMERNG